MSAGETHLVALASAARGIGAMANRLPSASVPATKLEQISCRMRRFCHAGDDMRRLSTVRTYNGLLPSKFSNGPKGVSGSGFRDRMSPPYSFIVACGTELGRSVRCFGQWIERTALCYISASARELRGSRGDNPVRPSCL